MRAGGGGANLEREMKRYWLEKDIFIDSKLSFTNFYPSSSCATVWKWSSPEITPTPSAAPMMRTYQTTTPSTLVLWVFPVLRICIATPRAAKVLRICIATPSAVQVLRICIATPRAAPVLRICIAIPSATPVLRISKPMHSTARMFRTDIVRKTTLFRFRDRKSWPEAVWKK